MKIQGMREREYLRISEEEEEEFWYDVLKRGKRETLLRE